MKTLDEQFQTIPDNRTGNAVQYQLPDVLKAAFAMFSLKSPSLLDFKTQTTAEEKNLHNIYRIEGEIPCDNQMRGILDPVDPQLLRPLFETCFSLLSEAGAIREYEYRDKHVIVSIDGVEHFSSTKAHCSSCTTRKHRNGEMSYHHLGLAVVIARPEQKEVIPLDFEPVLNQDGAQKNDCESNAAKRLCKALDTRYPDLKMILVEDALYANAPHIRQITGYGTLKNQGYHFEHNYGHDTRHLATVLALLMFLAFTVDQIQQRCCRFFRSLHQGLRTKVKLWASIRSLFSTLVFKSMTALYRHLAPLYRLQLE